MTTFHKTKTHVIQHLRSEIVEVNSIKTELYEIFSELSIHRKNHLNILNNPNINSNRTISENCQINLQNQVCFSNSGVFKYVFHDAV